MALAPTLASVEALYRKLERELCRTHHHRDQIHKADHFFNFCVTAHALHYFFERVGKTASVDQQPFHDQWAKEPLLVAVSDIANSTKHFILRDRHTRLARIPRTKRVRLKEARFVDIYVSRDGGTMVVPAVAPDAVITLSNDTKHDLYGFMAGVLDYWRKFLGSNGIRVRRQAFSKLRGSAT